MAISTPTLSNINVVATTSEYSAKSNLTENSGSFLTQATMLVYDEILRFQRGIAGYLPESTLEGFNYDEFEGNVLWFMDELVGIESDWKRTASNDNSTAYSYVQFTEASVSTAVTRYKYHIDQFNTRINNRDWEPRGHSKAAIEYPDWLIKLDNAIRGDLIGLSYVPYYSHKKHLGELTYDQMLALAFVHLHSKTSKDLNFINLSDGDVVAAKTIYEDNHHTDAEDKKTQDRIAQFFKIHYKTALNTTIATKDLSDDHLLKDKSAEDIMNSNWDKLVITIRSFFGWS